MIKLLIIDDHPLILEGSKNIFKDVVEISVETESNLNRVYSLVKHNFYDVFLVDINIPSTNGIKIAELIKDRQPSAIIILYTGDNIEDYYSLIIDRKIHSIISKTATKELIIKTIYACLNHQLLLPDNFIDFVQKALSYESSSKTLQLNAREIKILKLIAQGYTNQAIALELEISQRTIERTLSQVYAIFDVNTRAEAVLKAKDIGAI